MTDVLPAATLPERGSVDRVLAARSGIAARPSVLFVSHTGTMSGAELVLRDAVQPWAGSTAFLFEDGALTDALRGQGLEIRLARRRTSLAALRRDASPLSALPVLGRLCALALEITRAVGRRV